MATLLSDKIKPRNNGTFSLVDACDVEMPNGERLDNTIEHLLDDVVSLPEVTEADEGKFLRVVGGKWDLTELTNGNEVAY